MHLLYDEISPFTANRRVFAEYDDNLKDSFMLCMDTGYQTYRKAWVEDSNIHEVMRQEMPELIWNTRRIHGGLVWYKLAFSNSIVDFLPESIDGEEYWCIYKLKFGSEYDSAVKQIISVVDEDSKDVVYLYRVVDVDSVIRFPITEFENAFEMALQITAELTPSVNDEIEKVKNKN